MAKISAPVNSRPDSSFSRPWWLFNTHLETVWARHVGKTPRYVRKIIDTPDNDQVAFDFLHGDPDKPCLVIFHGLEGCSRSHSVRQVAMWFSQQGWSVYVPHFRTCGIMNKLPRAYHAGDSADCDWMLRFSKASLPEVSTMYALGISLGGNVLVKWLAENPGQQLIGAAAAVCAPLDLEASAKKMDGFFVRRTYGQYFLKKLRGKIYLKLSKYPFLIKPRQLERIRTLREFDELLTAPLHGFEGASDYYAKSSALPKLDSVATPLLLVHSENDAIVPVPQLPANDAITALRTNAGGHSGFVTPPFPGNANWISSQLCSFFTNS